MLESAQNTDTADVVPSSNDFDELSFWRKSFNLVRSPENYVNDFHNDF